MTISLTLSVRDESLIRYALGLAITDCEHNIQEAEKRNDITSAYKAKEAADKFRSISQTLRDLEQEELMKTIHRLGRD